MERVLRVFVWGFLWGFYGGWFVIGVVVCGDVWRIDYWGGRWFVVGFVKVYCWGNWEIWR